MANSKASQALKSILDISSTIDEKANKLYMDFEREVTAILIKTLKISNGDAQGVVEANEPDLKKAFQKGASAKQAAADIS